MENWFLHKNDNHHFFSMCKNSMRGVGGITFPALKRERVSSLAGKKVFDLFSQRQQYDIISD